MQQYLLGLDNGNTVTKAALFSLSGKEVAVAAEPVKTLYPAPGCVERDMNDVWQQTTRAIRQVLIKADIKAEQVAAIGCSGQGNGLYLLDRKQQPMLAIPSLDSRAADLVAEWKREGKDDAIYPINLQGIWSAQTGMILAWLKRHRSFLYKEIGTAFFCKDYINFCLTGVIATDYTDSSGAGLLDMQKKQYSNKLLELYGMPEAREFLPPLLNSTEIVSGISHQAASETGLVEGTPVVAGLFDVVASALGSGVVNTGQASIIAGTWSINQVITEKPINNPELFMSCVFDQERFMAIESSATSATNLDWFVNEFFGEEKAAARKAGHSVFEDCNELISDVPLSDNLPIYHPFLHGSNEHPKLRAGFFGISGGQGKAEMLKSLYEGVGFGHLSHVKRLRAAGAYFDSARLTGGGSRSEVWSQMFADILDIPVTIPAGTEIGAKGAAMAAGIGVGLFSSYQEGVASMTEVERQHLPDKKPQSLYKRRYQRYQLLVELMSEYCDQLQLQDFSEDKAEKRTEKASIKIKIPMGV
ncbi:carbohydrate kinase [Endozoicomonas sp. OPT23]|uniref:FGGY-family carbohydrate kinase n=1 Tax=Endozoicomonas sp. OPT23 TaxID=2072845 RepID=UPI00129B15BC|nr:FGGY-family carbohydrate kinase [Endozoicomonas sp. OPT23]MRI35151.1 carbohydrate kinase [Endozoicomonas sp. OPT23]